VERGAGAAASYPDAMYEEADATLVTGGEAWSLADCVVKVQKPTAAEVGPVAGRMPGHMNVLLAEANVPHPLLREMDEINPEFARRDVALVIERSMGRGYAGIDNELYVNPKTGMLFADARADLADLAAAVKAL
jgi:NAD(P) transhydrogenase subunit beta